MLYFESAFGWQPATYQADTEQKLLSASTLLVAVETQTVMESRRVTGESLGAALRVERVGIAGFDHCLPKFPSPYYSI